MTTPDPEVAADLEDDARQIRQLVAVITPDMERYTSLEVEALATKISRWVDRHVGREVSHWRERAREAEAGVEAHHARLWELENTVIQQAVALTKANTQ